MSDYRFTLPPSSAVIADIIRGHTYFEWPEKHVERLMGRVQCQCGDGMARDFHPSHVAHKVWKYLESICVQTEDA